MRFSWVSVVLSTVVSLAGTGLAAASPPTTTASVPTTTRLKLAIAAEAPATTLSETSGETEIRVSPQTLALWLIGLSLLGGAIALSFGAQQYNRNERWYRLEFLRKTVKEFESDPEIWKALKILDFEEYRDYEVEVGGRMLPFHPTNELLCAALGSHAERLQRKQKIDALIASNTLDEATREQYQIETEIRDWFNKLLNGLEHFGYLVESGMFTANEMRPWMIYWIRLIADREYKRQDASKFYDQLYTYIHDYGFSGVLQLFRQFGYRLLPTPYQEDDFTILSKYGDDFHVRTALSLAKASQLVYEDPSYVTEIAQRWGIVTETHFRYFNNLEQDTQAFLFKTNEFMVLAFRGSQEMRDWRTNFSTRLRKVGVQTTMQPLEEDWIPPIGQVHRGFQAAWESVETEVIQQIRTWNEGHTYPLPLFITGHSLGGALATVAAASLSKRKFDIQGLYTFGQPRAGDLIFASELNAELKNRIFRFVNSNDIVPHVPPPYLPWNPLRVYKHVGELLYFDWRGRLVWHHSAIARFLDLTIGLIRDAVEPGFDMIKEHCMEHYINHLQKALEVEQEKEKLMQETMKR